MGKGSTTIQAPPEINAAQAQGEFLFGKNFGQFEGITDPRLQQRLIGAERAGRQAFTGLELRDIGTFARGIEGGAVNPEYGRLEAELASLRAGQKAAQGNLSEQELREKAEDLYPSPKLSIRPTRAQRESRDRALKRREDYIERGLRDNRGATASEIASVEAQLKATPKTLERTPGLFDLLEESSQRAGALQREQLGLQRADDVAALQEFAPQVVEAQRMADPFSTEIAERMSRRALGQLTPEEERNVQQRARQASLSRGRIGDASSIAGEALGRSDYTAQFAAPAFQMNRTLAGDVGATILGRPSSAISLGGGVLGQAQAGAAGQMGPQLFDPNVGINMALQRQSDQFGLLGAQAQADAARSAGFMGALGQIGAAALMPAPVPCWVAREVYGIENPKWIMFRTWLLNDAPSWFRNLYIKYGERFAKFISNKPVLKTIIRKWMNTRIQ